MKKQSNKIVGAHTPKFRRATPPPPPTPKEETEYTRIINNPYYKRCIEIKKAKDGVWDVFIDGTWVCTRNAWENIVREVGKIMKEIDSDG